MADMSEQLLQDIRNSILALPDQLVHRLEQSRGPDLFDRARSKASSPANRQAEGEKPWYNPQSKAGAQITALEQFGFALGRFIPEFGQLASMSSNVRHVLESYDNLGQKAPAEPRPLAPDVPAVAPSLQQHIESKPVLAEAVPPHETAYPELPPGLPAPAYGQQSIEQPELPGVPTMQPATPPQSPTPELPPLIADIKYEVTEAVEQALKPLESKTQLERETRLETHESEAGALPVPLPAAAEERGPFYKEFPHLRPQSNEAQPDSLPFSAPPPLLPDLPDVPEGEPATVGGETADDMAGVVKAIDELKTREDKVVALLERIERVLLAEEDNNDDDETTSSSKQTDETRRSAWRQEKEKEGEQRGGKSAPDGPKINRGGGSDLASELFQKALLAML